MEEVSLAISCNICGMDIFGPGPGGRLSATGKPPLCMRCNSLERHRTLRHIHNNLRQQLDYSTWSCLQISPDIAAEAGWFATHVVSTYGKSNSMDIQDIPLPNGSFDCVLCNHVLEHVADDGLAISELFRITSTRGFAQIGVPDPARNSLTKDWGYPRSEEHGHYRTYGVDVIEKMKNCLRDAYVVVVAGFDPVTAMEDIYYFLTRSTNVVERLLSSCADSRCIHIDDGGLVDEGCSVHASTVTSIRQLVPQILHGPTLLKNPIHHNAYVMEPGHKDVQGWVSDGALSAVTAFSALQQSLEVKGHICEIGVHHGRFFIALSLLGRFGERSLAIDVFEEQEKNVDLSGKGNRDIFLSNVEKWLGSKSEACIITSDSLDVAPENILRELGGPIRLFSIDGSHTRDHTLNDMRLAEETIVPGGLVILDDFFNPAWPGVAEALFSYLSTPGRPKKLVPIAYGDNKFYLTTPSHGALYSAFVTTHLISRAVKYKPVTLCSQNVSFMSLPSPAETFVTLPLKPGEKIDIGSIENEQAMLGGWHKKEALGRWAKPGWVGIALNIAVGFECKQRVTVYLGLSVPKGILPVPEVGVWANRTFLTTLRLGTYEYEYKVVLQARDIVGGRTELWFYNPRALDLSSEIYKNEKRELSFFLRSVRRPTLDD
jgi:predicted SAM-dependent methyltransferase